MSRPAIILAASAFALVLIAQNLPLYKPDYTAPSAGAIVPSRYQLIPAEQTWTTSAGITTMRSVYRLDTATGQTWRLNSYLQTDPDQTVHRVELWEKTIEGGTTTSNPTTTAQPSANQPH